MAQMVKQFITNGSIFKRLLAFLADLLIINLVILEPFRNMIVGAIGEGLQEGSLTEMFNALQQNETLVSQIYVSSIFIGIIMLLYFSLFEWKLGQTPGKMLFQLYAVKADEVQLNTEIKKPFSRMGFFQSVVRNAYLIPIFPFFLLIFIDPVYLFFNPRNQRLSEMLSGTMIVERVIMVN